MDHISSPNTHISNMSVIYFKPLVYEAVFIYASKDLIYLNLKSRNTTYSNLIGL
jgi:hypothetical protein